VIYFGQGLGSIFSRPLIEKKGDIWTMARGAAICIPYTLSLILPASKLVYDLDGWYVSSEFIYPLVLITSMFNGLGEGAA
jgi:hypothetical protein